MIMFILFPSCYILQLYTISVNEKPYSLAKLTLNFPSYTYAVHAVLSSL